MTEATNNVVDLFGSYRHKVDAKGRTSLPAAFRKALPAGLVVTPNPQNECIYVFYPESFNAWVDGVFEKKFGGFDDSNPKQVNLRRKLKAQAKSIEVDSAGRIAIGDYTAQTGIDKDVVIVGNTGYIEIWDAQRYDRVDEETDLADLFS